MVSGELEHMKFQDRVTDLNGSQTSHAPKVSVGVMLETSGKAKFGNTTISTSAQQKCKSSKGKMVEEDGKMGLSVLLEGKESVAPNQESGGWVSPKSLCATKHIQLKNNADHNLNLQSGNVEQNIFMDANCGRSNETRVSNGKMEEFAFFTGHEMHFSDKGIDRRLFSFEKKVQKDGNLDKVDEFAFTSGAIITENGKLNQQELEASKCGGNVALRLKLSEILGTAPSQKDQNTNVPDLETDPRNSKSSLKGSIKPKYVKAKQNSDTIETDSESPYQAAKTPLTRSRTRKKASGKGLSKLQHEVSGNLFSKSSKVKCQDKKPFSLHKAEKQAGKSLITSEMENTPLEGKTASDCSKKEVSRHQEKICSSIPVNAGSLDFQSPTLAINSPMVSGFQKTSYLEGTALGNTFPVDGRSKLRELHTRISRSPQIASSTELPSDSSEGNQAFKSQSRGSSPLKEQNDTPKQLSLPTTEEQNNESLGKDKISSKGFKATSRWSSGTLTPQPSPDMFFCSNKLQIERPETHIKSFLISPSPDGYKKHGDSGFLQGISSQNPDDALSRAVFQFALVLEQYRAKVKLHTNEKCSEILASVANGVHSQLQGIQTRISTDVEKLSSLSRSKRKRLESKFEEQQERFKVTHDKFKEELNTHLEEYRTTLEELEAYHLELKANADRQKASCKKLLLQAEEAIRAQLCDAERSIVAIHKGAWKKMQGLRFVLRTCLKEDF